MSRKVIDIIPDIVARAKKPSSPCMEAVKRSLRNHQIGFNGEHIARQTLLKKGYKNVDYTRHKAAMDLTTSRLAYEVKTFRYTTKNKQMGVSATQKAKKLLWSKTNNKKPKSIIVLIDGKAEVFIKDGIGKFRVGSMQKIGEYKDWKKEIGEAKRTPKYRKKIKPKVKKVEFTEIKFGYGEGEKHFEQFLKGRDGLPKDYQPFVSSISKEEYKKRGVKLFVSKNGKSGYGIDKDGTLVSLYAKQGTKQGCYAVQSAIKNGATRLDCFDGKLPKFYDAHGFIEYDRSKWDPKQAPDNWNYDRFGKPDYIFMKLQRGLYEL